MGPEGVKAILDKIKRTATHRVEGIESLVLKSDTSMKTLPKVRTAKNTWQMLILCYPGSHLHLPPDGGGGELLRHDLHQGLPGLETGKESSYLYEGGVGVQRVQVLRQVQQHSQRQEWDDQPQRLAPGDQKVTR